MINGRENAPAEDLYNATVEEIKAKADSMHEDVIATETELRKAYQ